MIKISVCSGCGRTSDDKFCYCPWCGKSRNESNSEENLDKMFSRLDAIQNQVIRRKINAMEQQLDDLENELSVLVLSAEMHK